MPDYHEYQLDDKTCGGRNCAACSTAMAIAFATRYAVKINGDRVRKLSGRSCTPQNPPDAHHSRSGGLYISDVVKVAAHFHVPIDYHLDANDVARSWTRADARQRIQQLREGAIVLGHFGALPRKYRVGSFTGEHSAFVHAYRASDDTVGWHDPLRRSAIRLPWSALMDYWEAGPYVRLAGFVRKLDVVRTRNRAPLRAKPRGGSKMRARLNRGERLAVIPSSDDTFLHVYRIADGKRGWVRASRTRGHA